MENLTIKVIKLEMENDELKRDYLSLDETNKNHVLRIIELMQEIEQLKSYLSEANQNAAFYRCCALSGEVFTDGNEPYPKLEGKGDE